MASILCIETSTEVCSVAFCRNGKVISTREDKNGKNHSLLLTRYIEEVISQSELSFSQLDAVAVSGGPGSYTGLRIGVSSAKGLCFAAGIPLIAISSLQAMTTQAIQQLMEQNAATSNDLFCPMIDARRMEVYTALYNLEMEQVQDIHAEIIDEQSFRNQLTDHKIWFFGNGAEKCKPALSHPNAHFLDEIYASAIGMAELAEQAFQSGSFVDLAYFEPRYLKDFIATVPTKNIFLSGEKI